MLVRAVRDASRPIKEAILWLCERINERSASFLDRTAAVAVAAQSALTAAGQLVIAAISRH
jgi:hypothetical protein